MMTVDQINGSESVVRYVGYGDFQSLECQVSGSIRSIFWAINSPVSLEILFNDMPVLIASGNGHWDFAQSRMFTKQSESSKIRIVNNGIDENESISIYIKLG